MMRSSRTYAMAVTGTSTKILIVQLVGCDVGNNLKLAALYLYLTPSLVRDCIP